MGRFRGNILDEIMEHHRDVLPKLKREVPIEDLRALAATVPPPRSFYNAIAEPGVSVIAECKKASPSKGLLVHDYNPAALALDYEAAGARAVSILTDRRFFQGSIDDLASVRQQIGIPTLRKDFIFDPYQIFQSRAAQVDAILLIASVLSDSDLSSLLNLTHKLKMNALVEVHDEGELDRALAVNAKIIGINNRDLETFIVDPEITLELREKIPNSTLVVSESGIKTTDDILRLKEIGIDAVLIGETFVRSKNVTRTVSSFVKSGKLT